MAEARANLNIGANTSEAVAAIKNLQRQISTFYTSISKGSAASQAAVANMQKNLVNSINATGQFSARVQTISSTTESFTNALEKNKLSMGQYFRYAGAASGRFGKQFTTEINTINKVATERVKDLQTQYIQLGRDANGAMKAIAVRPATLDLNNFTTQTQIAAQKQAIFNQLIQQGSTNLLNWGKNTQWAGRQLMVGFTIPLTIFATTAGRAFMALEEQAIKFKRVYGDLFTTGAQTEQALAEMRALGDEFTKFGVAVEETVGLAATVAQMGKTGADLTAQVTEATRLSVLGGMSQEQALDTTIGLTNAFGVSVEDLTNKVNFLNAAENQTILSIQDFNEAVPRAGSVVSQLGGDVEDLAFFMASMREGGIEASQAANALKSSLGRLINPTQRARDRLKEYGIDVTGIVERNTGDLRGTVMELAYALDELEPLEKSRAIEQLFGKFQFARMSTLFQNIIKEGSQAGTILDLINSSASDLSTIAGRELGRVEESAATKFTAALERFQAALAPIGAEFLKLATPILEFGTKLLENFNNLGDGTKKAVTIIIAAIGGIMPVALMAIGLTANLVANIIKGLNRVRLFFQRFKGQAQDIATQTDYLTQQQIESQAVSASLEQSHQRLSQSFNVEADALNRLTQAYERAIAKQRAFRGDIVTTSGMAAYGNARAVRGYNDGVVSVPGTGNTDTVPAMLTPGEAVIPKEMAKRYAPIINAMVAGNVPGYMDGLGVPGVMASLPRATREGSYVASHGNLTAPTNLLSTIKAASAVNKEFAETKVVVWQLHQELDEAGNVIKRFKTVSEMTFAELGQMADENQLALQAGRQYAGSTITTTAERNAALNDLNFAGEPMRLEDLVDVDGQGDGSDLTSQARQAKAENTAAYQRHTDEIEQMIAQGQVYENAIAEGASVEELKTDYARAQIRNYIAEAEVKKNGLSIEQAQIEADKRLIAIDNQYASLQERRMAYLGAAIAVNPEVVTAPVAVGRDTLGQVSSSRRGNLFPTVGSNPTGRLHPTGGPSLKTSLPNIYPSIDNAVHGVMDQALDYIPVSVDKHAQSYSPSKKVQRSAKNLVDGFLVSLRNASDDMQNAGAQLGQAAVSGMVSQGGHNVPLLTPDYISSQAPVPTTAGAGLPVVGQTSIWMPGVKENLNQSFEEVSSSARKTASATEETTKSSKSLSSANAKSEKSTKNLGGAIMGTSFALTGLVGAASMFDNKLGEMAQKIMPFTGAISGATVALLMLKDTAIGTAAANRVQSAQSAFTASAGAAAGSMFGKFGNILKGVGKFVAKLLGPLGILVTAVSAGYGIFKLFNAQAQKNEQRLQGLANAISLTTDQVDGLAEKLGAQVTPSVFDQPFNIGDRPMDPADYAAGKQLIEDYGGEREFAKEFKPAIDAIMAAEGEELERAIEAMVVGLFGQGFGEEAITEFLAALGIATEKTNLFENIDVSSLQFINEDVVDLNILRDVGKKSAQAYVDAYNEEVSKADKKQFTPEEEQQIDDRIKQLQDDIALQQSALEETRSQRTQASIAGKDTSELDKSIEIQEKNLKESQQLLNEFTRGFSLDLESLQIPLNELSAATVQTLRGVSAAFSRGEISLEDFESGIEAALSGIKGINDEAARLEAIKSIATDLFPEQPEIAETLSDVEDLEIISKQLSLQMEIDPEYLDLISKANSELQLNGEISTQTQNALNAARRVQVDLINQEAIARQRANEQEQISQAQAAIAESQEANQVTQDKIDAYYDLVDAGASAAVAYKIVGDSALYATYTQLGAGEAAKTAGVDFETFLETVRNAIQLEKEFAGLNPTRSDGGGQAETSAFDQITASLRKFANAQVKVTSGFEDTIAEIENFINVSGALTGEFGGLNQELRGLGLHENLIEMIVGMDPDEYEKRKNDLFIFDDQGTIIGMTSKLQGLNQALNTAVIGEFVNEQNNITVSVGHQITALQRLTNAGASYQAAYRAVQNTALSAAIATAKSSAQIQAAAEAAMRAQEMMDEFEEINEEELRRERIRDAIVEQNREFSNQAKILNYITRNTNRLSEAQKQAILGDKDLQALILEPGIAPGALQTALDNANKREALELEIKKLTITGQQEIFEDGLSKAMEAFSAQEQELELKFKTDTAENQKIADAATEEIAKLQFQLDDYEAGIEEIETQEDLINEVYDKRIESLDDIEDANERITRQQEAQLNIAEALSRGDIAAAAQAAQEARSLAAENAAEEREARVEKAREAELRRVRSRGGLGREDLEKAIQGIEQQIFRIEEDRLEPAEEAIRLADVRKEADIEALTVLGKTKTEWDEIKNRVDLAVVSNYKFVDAIQEALEIVEKLIEALGKGRPELANAIKIVSSGGGGDGKDKKSRPVALVTTGRTSIKTGEQEVEEYELTSPGVKLTGATLVAAYQQAKADLARFEQQGPGAAPLKSAGKGYEEGLKTAIGYLGQSLAREGISPSDVSKNYSVAPSPSVGGGFAMASLKPPPKVVRSSGSSSGGRDSGGDERSQSSREKRIAEAVSASKAKDAARASRAAASANAAARARAAAMVSKAREKSGGNYSTAYLYQGRAMGGLIKKYAMGGFVRRALPGPPSQSAGYAGGGFVRNRISAPPQMFDLGGKVIGPGTSTSDSIPALLSDGEYVINAKAVERIGVPNLDRLNNQSGKFFQQMKDGVLAFASGGRVSIRVAERRAAQKKPQTTYNPGGGTRRTPSRPTIRSVEKSAPEKIASSRSSSSRSSNDDRRSGGSESRSNSGGSSPAARAAAERARRLEREKERARLLRLKKEREREKALANIKSSVSNASSYGPLQARAMESQSPPTGPGTPDRRTPSQQQSTGGDISFFDAANFFNPLAISTEAVVKEGRMPTIGEVGIDLGLFAAGFIPFVGPGIRAAGLGAKGATRGASKTGKRADSGVTSDTRVDLVTNQEIYGPRSGTRISNQLKTRFEQEKIAQETRRIFNTKRPQNLGPNAKKEYNELRDAMVRMDRTSIGPKFPVPKSVSDTIPHISELSGKDLLAASKKLNSTGSVLPEFDNLSRVGIRTSPGLLRTSNRRTAVSEVDFSNIGKMSKSIPHKILNALGILTPNKRQALYALNEIARTQNAFLRGALPLPANTSLDTLSARFVGQLGAYPKLNIGNAAGVRLVNRDFEYDPRAYVSSGPSVSRIVNSRGDSLSPETFAKMKVPYSTKNPPLGPLSTLIDENILRKTRGSDFTIMHEYSHIYDKMAKISSLRLPTSTTGYVSQKTSASLNAIEEASAKIFDAAVSGKGSTSPYPPFDSLEQIAKNPEFLFKHYGRGQDRWYQFGSEWLTKHLSVIKEGAKQFNIPVYSPKAMRNLEEVNDFLNRHGAFGSLEANSAPSLQFFQELAKKAKEEMSARGINKLSAFANGGYVMGSDTIPAMLTRGEYVIKRPAVENFGVDNLEKINNGTYSEGSVYNYNLSVNVKSDSNPDQIARTVMDQIKRVDSQRIRGNRF